MMLDGDQIRRRRDTLGLTQAQLAKNAGYDTRTIQRAEAGTPILNQAAAVIAQALKVRLDQIRPRQLDLLDVEAKKEIEASAGVVMLLPCRSGRTLHQAISGTDFL